MTTRRNLRALALIVMVIMLSVFWMIGCSGGGGGGGGGGYDPAPTHTDPTPYPTVIPTTEPLPDPPSGSGTVGFTSNQSGLQVYVYDRLIGITEIGQYLVEYLSPGTYDIYYTDAGGRAIVFYSNISVNMGDKIPIDGVNPSPTPTQSPTPTPTATPTPSPTPTPTTSPVETGSVGGTVSDTTGNPISGAKVTIATVHNYTEASGNFFLHPVPVGYHRVLISKQGFKDTETFVNVEKGKIAVIPENQTIMIPESSPSPTPTYSPTPSPSPTPTPTTSPVETGSVGGTVSDTTGNPISGAKVTIATVHNYTEASGNFFLHPVPVGYHRVLISKQGFKDTETFVNVEKGKIAVIPENQTIMIPESSPSPTPTYSPTPSPSPTPQTIVNITVYNETEDYQIGTPEPGVTVQFYQYGLPYGTAQITDSNGFTRYTNIPTQKFSIKLTKSGFTPTWYDKTISLGENNFDLIIAKPTGRK